MLSRPLLLLQILAVRHGKIMLVLNALRTGFSTIITFVLLSPINVKLMTKMETV